MLNIIKKHWISITFVAASAAFNLLSYCEWEPWLNIPSWAKGVVILVLMAACYIGELIKSKGRIVLKFDRSISESSLSQFWVAVIMFVMVFDGLLAINRLASTSDSSTQIFSDMVSPMTMRSAAYADKKDTITLCKTVFIDSCDTVGMTGIQCTDLDSVKVIVTTVKDANLRTESKSWKALLPILVYMLGLVVFSGVLVATINRMFATRAERFRNGLTHYKFRKHIVIIGAGDNTLSLVKHLVGPQPRQSQKPRKDCPIVIMTKGKVNAFRKRLHSDIAPEYLDQIVVLYGDQTSKTDLQNVRVEKASDIYILGDTNFAEIERSSHDADNVNTLKNVKGLLSGSSTKVNCYMMFEYQTAFTAFQFSDLGDEVRSVMNFIPFNIYQMIAQNTLICKSLKIPETGIKPLEGEAITYESPKHVHLVVIGITTMGTALALEAAQQCHYPNFLRDKSLKTRITFIDPEADEQMRFFMGRYRDLFSVSPWRYIAADKDDLDYCGTRDFPDVEWHRISDELYDKAVLGEEFVDVEWEFVKGGNEMAQVQAYLRHLCYDENAVLTLAVCLDKTHKNLATALYLPTEVYDKALQVLVYQPENDSIVTMLHYNENVNIESKRNWSKRYQQLHCFGLKSESMDLAHFDHRLAQCVNYIYNTVNYKAESDDGGADYTLSKIKENSDLLAEWEKDLGNGKPMTANHWSSIYSANSLWSKLRSIGWREGQALKEEDIQRLSETEHNRWNIEQLIANYRPVRKSDAKGTSKELKQRRIHPDLKAYEKMDDSTKKYDRAIIKALPWLYEQN